jgi:hypothetical protein
VIDSTGITFSKEKKQEVRNLLQPKFLKQLQSFLGLVNYFGDHIRNLATEVAGLRKLLKVLKVTSEEEIKLATRAYASI